MMGTWRLAFGLLRVGPYLFSPGTVEKGWNRFEEDSRRKRTSIAPLHAMNCRAAPSMIDFCGSLSRCARQV